MKLKSLVFSLLLFTMFAAASSHAAYVVGDPIADFTLNDASGTPVSLFEYRGMVVMINFWTDT